MNIKAYEYVYYRLLRKIALCKMKKYEKKKHCYSKWEYWAKKVMLANDKCLKYLYRKMKEES